MIRVKRLSGTWHPQRPINFVTRPFKNRDKPKRMVCPGDIIDVDHVLNLGNLDQWQLISPKGEPIGSFDNVIEKNVDIIVADDGSKFKRKKIIDRGEITKKLLESDGNFINTSTKHDGDVKHYVDTQTGKEYLLHPNDSVELLKPKSETNPFQLVPLQDGLYNVVNRETGKPVHDKPLSKKEAQKLM